MLFCFALLVGDCVYIPRFFFWGGGVLQSALVFWDVFDMFSSLFGLLMLKGFCF